MPGEVVKTLLQVACWLVQGGGDVLGLSLLNGERSGAAASQLGESIIRVRICQHTE